MSAAAAPRMRQSVTRFADDTPNPKLKANVKRWLRQAQENGGIPVGGERMSTSAKSFGSRSKQRRNTANFNGRATLGQRNARKLSLRPDGTMVDAAYGSRRMTIDSQTEQGLSEILNDDDQNHRQKKAWPWFLIHPSNPTVGCWDALTSATLIFVAIFTPAEVAFLPAPTQAADPLFVLGRCVDGIFIADMALQFFLLVPKAGEPGSWETRWLTIIWSYLNGWFLLDLFSVCASVFDIVPLFVGGSEDGEEGISALSTFRVVRILRLVKLVRLLKASRRLKEWSVKIATPRATLTIVSTLIEFMFVVHWCACVLALMTIAAASPLDTWLATHGYCR